MSFDFGTTVDGAGDFRFLQGLSVEVREETQIGGWRFQRLSHWTIAFGIGAVTACAIPQIDGASLSNIVSPSEPTATCQQYHCDTGENDRLFSYKQLMCPADNRRLVSLTLCCGLLPIFNSLSGQAIPREKRSRMAQTIPS